MLQKKLRTLCGLDPRSQNSCFLRSEIGFTAHPQKRQDTAALQNVAVVSRPFLACVVECGAASAAFRCCRRNSERCAAWILVPNLLFLLSGIGCQAHPQSGAAAPHSKT